MPNEIPNRVDTRFATASAGKAFVAAGIMRLVDEGRLRLTDELGQIRPFDLNRIDPRITVSQLLCHTSGMADYFDERVMDDYALLWRDFPNYRVRRSADLLPLFAHLDAVCRPGEKFLYNNAGYVVLGLVIEKITGAPFDEYLKAAVFDAAGMAQTGYFELDRLPANCAGAYIFDDSRGDYYTNIFSVDCKGTGAGGAFTTVLDVDAFWDALRGGKIVSDAALGQMFAPQAEGKYGYGFWLDKAGDGFAPHFEGCDPGVCFVSQCDPASGDTVTVVSNNASDVWRIADELRNTDDREFAGR